MSAEEFRIIDPNTGGEKGSKLARFDLLPWDALWAVAEQYGRGAEKYSDRNWERSYAWGLSHAAIHRHLAQFWNGEDVDEETGGLHLAAVVWHALALLTFQLRGIGTDTRPTTPAPPQHEHEPFFYREISNQDVVWMGCRTCNERSGGIDGNTPRLA